MCHLAEISYFVQFSSSDLEGGSLGSLKPPPHLLISYENEIIWSQRDQIISFSLNNYGIIFPF